MWLPRTNSTIRVRSRPTSFSCSSFKDIQNLCAEDYEANLKPQPSNTPRPSIFHRVRLAKSFLRAWTARLPPSAGASPPLITAPPPESKQCEEASVAANLEPTIYLRGSEKRVVVYFTSLRVVRSTFEACRTVRSILRSFRVTIDERDVSMDSRFMDELQAILGNGNKITLPRVFIGGRYIGGADEVLQLHEAGELKKFIHSLPPAEQTVCEVCGGYRFILCDECSGSHKCYSEKGGFRTCGACNENGLIRCPSCLSSTI